MAEFPILEEFKNYIYYNLETIFLIIVPLAGLIGFLTNKVTSRIKEVEDDADTKINDLKGVVSKAEERVNKLSEKLNDFEVDVSSDITAIKAVLNIAYDVENLSSKYKRKKRVDKS